MKHLKSITAAALVTAFSVAAGCGGSSDSGSPTSTTDGGAGGPAADGSTSPGTGNDAQVQHPPVDGGTACGQTSCDPATESCCIGQNGGTCVAKNATCQGIAVACQSGKDCSGGQVCCATVSGVSCQTTCDPSSGRQLCASDAECTAPDTCQNLGGIKYCGQPFTVPDGGFGFDASAFRDASAHD